MRAFYFKWGTLWDLGIRFAKCQRLVLQARIKHHTYLHSFYVYRDKLGVYIVIIVLSNQNRTSFKVQWIVKLSKVHKFLNRPLKIQMFHGSYGTHAKTHWWNIWLHDHAILVSKNAPSTLWMSRINLYW